MIPTETMPQTPETIPTDPGHETVAVALDTLRTGLDSAATTITQARDAAASESRLAEAERDRRLREAATTLEATLARVEQQSAETRAQIAERHEARVLPARQQRADSLEKARAELKRKSEKARKAREEAHWLADTVMESGSPKARQDYEDIRGRVARVTTELDLIEANLIRALGPARAAIVASAPAPEPAPPESPTIDRLELARDQAASAAVDVEKGGPLKLLRSKSATVDLGVTARNAVFAARAIADAVLTHAALRRDATIADLGKRREAEIQAADLAAKKLMAEADKAMGQVVRESDEQLAAKLADLEARRDRDLAEVERWITDQTAKAHAASESARSEAISTHASRTRAAEELRTTTERDARAAITETAASALTAVHATTRAANAACPPWADPAWLTRAHPASVPGVVPIGSVRLDLAPRLARLDKDLRSTLALPDTLTPPLPLTLPGPTSLLIDHDAAGREPALAALRNLMLRVLGAFPAGKVRFTMADPIGLGQSFAGFMRLADQEPSPVGLRIWSEPSQIERQLADLTEHMQTVIQKYLRADYATIEDYNHAAGEIAEPYRFVIIADLPTALTENGAARLASILESGPRCGVYALLAGDLASKLPPTLSADTLKAHAVRINLRKNTAKLPDPRFDECEISLDAPPDDAFASALLDRVAQAGKDAGRVEVPFERLVPSDTERWTRSAATELSIPLGRSGAQKIQHLRLGTGTRQHALIAGRTGSGKSTLLHVMISAAALWHSPDELNLYLIDFKKGVEFKAYTGGNVPHVRAVAIESDREFGLSVLQRLDDELTTRGDLFRKLGAQDLAAARRLAPDTPLPRVLLLIDEFQEFFVSDDTVASEATLLLDRLVRQGRAFGVHVILGSQTLSGAYSLARSTLGQMGVRIALQCSEADSYLILGEDNNAARLLSRPGEAIYNDAGGLVEGNSPFQTAWLPDTNRDAQLARMPAPPRPMPAPVVFEGNAPARLDTAVQAFALANPDRSIPRALLGDPVAIAPPVAAILRKRSGANLLILGPQPEPALGMLSAACITAAATPNARVILIDPTPEDDALHGRTAQALRDAGTNADLLTHRDAARIVSELAATVRARQDTTGGDPIILALAGLHRLRDLRKSDSFASFSLDDDASASAPDKDLAYLLREGPGVGVWTLAWCDTLTNLERALERSTVREFGLRAVMQVSASDSAALLDSSAASTLGANRVLLADDEAGTTVKIRPIDLPDAPTAARAGDILRA